MTCNVGSLDRIVRLALGVVLLALAAFALTGVWAWVAAALGVVMLGVAATRVCPLYLPFGIRT